MKIPGFVGDVIEFNLTGAFKPQPVLALGAAIALTGLLTGRKITDRQGTRTNVYCLGVCESGGGKERARQVNKDILFGSGLDHMIGPEGVASHAGLVAAVEREPATLFQLDEIGRMLRTLADPSRSPHLYHGTTVPQSLYEGLTAENLTDGFYSRMMGFESDDDDPIPQNVTTVEVPDQITSVAGFWGDFCPGGNLSREHPQPLVVQYSPEAQQMMIDLERLSRDERKKQSVAVSGLWTRTTEKARKLALIYACSENHQRPYVDDKTASWACYLSDYLTRRRIAKAIDWVSENPYEAKLKRLYRDIRKAGPTGLTRTQIYEKTRHLQKRERDELIDRLLELGDIRQAKEDTLGAPRNRLTAVWEYDDVEALPT